MKAVRIFNKELENVKKNQSELKNTVTEKKNILEGIDSRLDDIEEHISDLEDKIMESAQWKQQKGKQILETEDSIRDLWDSNMLIFTLWAESQKEKEERKGRKCKWWNYAWKVSKAKEKPCSQVQEAQIWQRIISKPQSSYVACPMEMVKW